MTLPSNINDLIEQLNQELTIIEEDATVGLSLARSILDRFPENAGLVQIFASFSSAMLFVETERRRIQSISVNLLANEKISDDEIQEAGEDLSSELGRVLETKMLISRLRNRLEDLL
jgi:hypothetical protein